MNKKLFAGLIAISAGILIAIGTMAWTNPTNNPPIGSGAGFFPSGTQIVFFQASCPSGWTQNAGYNDLMMRIVSGAGGGTGGSWTISGLSSAAAGEHSHTGPGHTHSMPRDGWGLQYSDNPTGRLLIVTSNTGGYDPEWAAYSDNTTGAAGNGATGNAGSHNHTISSDASWRPAYLNAIICQKN